MAAADTGGCTEAHQRLKWVNIQDRRHGFGELGMTTADFGACRLKTGRGHGEIIQAKEVSKVEATLKSTASSVPKSGRQDVR